MTREIVDEERTIYRVARQREIRCRLWYEITPFRDGMVKDVLIGIEELE